jgi:nicotinate dehydrogenase subunit B
MPGTPPPPSQSPASLVGNPRFEQWLDWSEPGYLVLKVGKVELGQGITTALAQMAAEELGLEFEQVRVVCGDTRCCPDEWYTAGSLTIEVCGAAVRRVCAEARLLLLARAEQRLNAPAARLDAAAGRLSVDGIAVLSTFWDLATEIDWSVRVPADATLRTAASFRCIGRSVARVDLERRITGAAFLHDLEWPGLMHARIVFAPRPDAALVDIDQVSFTARWPSLRIVRDGRFVAVVGAEEAQAVDAAAASARWTEWRTPAKSDHAPVDAAWLLRQPSTLRTVAASGGGPRAAATLRSRYSKPFIAHASIGPSCAVALFAERALTVWTHSQGVFALRAALLGTFGDACDRIDVIHAPGAGCYGHNGADDAAAQAALIALRLPGAPIRVQWSREDELTQSPLGSAMVMQVEARLESGRITAWSLDVTSGNHGQRPGWDRRRNLPVFALLEGGVLEPPPEDDVAPVAGGGGDRNAVALYDIPQDVRLHHVPVMPVRTSSLRTLGAFGNVFAIESFMDELAQADGSDPIAFRLRHLVDPRAVRVLSELRARVPQIEGQPRGTGSGWGVGFARYKNKAAYMAIAVHVVLEEDVRIDRVEAIVDCGLAVNPDGVRNQVEGGIVQALSWTLKEARVVHEAGADNTGWAGYPILTFAEVPEAITIHLIPDDASPPLGVGEVAAGPTAAALANAVAFAADVRVRDLPLTRERLASALA